MTAFAHRVAAATGVPEERLKRLAGGDLSEVLLVTRPDGRSSVAKGGSDIATEAAMLRALVRTGAPAPAVEAEFGDALVLEHVANDRMFTPRTWADVGEALRRLHSNHGDRYGWSADYRLGSVELDNRQTSDWPAFWGDHRLVATARILDRPWRERVERLAARLGDLLPPAPAAALLHGDLWTGNILVREGRLAAFIDPACYYGHCEVDLAMLTLFDVPEPSFWEAYGPLEPGWRKRRPLYQLFPALVHLRLFGAGYSGMADRLLQAVGA